MNKEQLQKQLEEMKAKVAEMEKELNKGEKFEWKYPKDKTFVIGAYSTHPECSGEIGYYLSHGRYRIKEANAKLALQRNKEANVIEALAEQLDPDWVADWDNEQQNKYYVFLSKNEYKCSWNNGAYSIGVPYMSRQTAVKICDMLNNGEIEL